MMKEIEIYKRFWHCTSKSFHIYLQLSTVSLFFGRPLGLWPASNKAKRTSISNTITPWIPNLYRQNTGPKTREKKRLEYPIHNAQQHDMIIYINTDRCEIIHIILYVVRSIFFFFFIYFFFRGPLPFVSNTNS